MRLRKQRIGMRLLVTGGLVAPGEDKTAGRELSPSEPSPLPERPTVRMSPMPLPSSQQLEKTS